MRSKPDSSSKILPSTACRRVGFDNEYVLVGVGCRGFVPVPYNHQWIMIREDAGAIQPYRRPEGLRAMDGAGEPAGKFARRVPRCVDNWHLTCWRTFRMRCTSPTPGSRGFTHFVVRITLSANRRVRGVVFEELFGPSLGRAVDIHAVVVNVFSKIRLKSVGRTACRLSSPGPACRPKSTGERPKAWDLEC